jgi:hypothetical protein
MKTVGLITFHKYHNYGAVLQAYAMQQYILRYETDYTCEIIDYYEPNLLDISAFTPHRLYGPMNAQDEYRADRIQYCKEIHKRKVAFNTFISREMLLSRPWTSRQELLDCPPVYDIYLSGSDQIWNWNREYTRYRLLPYLLWFTHSPNKIAYGCGMNSDEQGKIYIPFSYLPAIRSYKSYMLREASAVAQIERITGRTDIHQVLDPVLLLDKKDYQPLCSCMEVDPYIFAYLFDYDKEKYERMLEELSVIAKTMHQKVRLITNTVPVHTEEIDTILEAGPAEWLGLLRNASMVLTNSFHGMAYAVNFGKKFYVYGRDERKKSLLDMLDITMKEAKNVEEIISILQGPAYDCSVKLEIKRQESRELIHQALESCNGTQNLRNGANYGK